MFRKRTILLVDDEPVVRALLRVALEPAGLRMCEAADGSQALEVAWRERPSLVLLDVALPKLSGIDVCRALKTNPEPPVVLLLTGNADHPDIDACGADGVILKPFRPADVLDHVDRALAQSVR